MPPSSSSRRTDRRRFLKLVGLAGLSSAVNATMLSWSHARQSPRGAAVTAKVPSDTAQVTPGKPQEISEDARALAAILERRYGDHLNAEQLVAVTQEIDGRLQGGKRLREVKLANHDEPDFTFHA